MTMTHDPLVGRSTDPTTSTPGVRRQVKGRKAEVLAAAHKLGRTFTDTELQMQVERDTGKRVDRGVVARTRLNLEREGYIKRLFHEETDSELLFVLL